jgi:hypothetical protein
MEKNTKEVSFVGGPLDGQTKHIQSNAVVYKLDQPPLSNDIKLGEVPVGFFPPMHEYVYEERPPHSGIFVCVEQHHQ